MAPITGRAHSYRPAHASSVPKLARLVQVAQGSRSKSE
jgi:hypothetical protein